MKINTKAISKTTAVLLGHGAGLQRFRNSLRNKSLADQLFPREVNEKNIVLKMLGEDATQDVLGMNGISGLKTKDMQ